MNTQWIIRKLIKFSFLVTSSGTIDRCIIEDLPSVNQSFGSPSHHQLSVHFNNHHSLSPDPRRQSNTSIRHGSTFDLNYKEIFERQQKQERSANIRTTLTLFIVTVTFILMYLPSIIITLFNIKPSLFREPLFLLYYINSAVSLFRKEKRIDFMFWHSSAILWSTLSLISTFGMIFGVSTNVKNGSISLDNAEQEFVKC